MLFLIALPLKLSFQDLILRNVILRNISQLSYENPHWFGTRLREIYINLDLETPLIQFDVIAPLNVISETDIKTLETSLSQQLGQPVNIEINLFEFKNLN
jgi:hypothetical protein